MAGDGDLDILLGLVGVNTIFRNEGGAMGSAAHFTRVDGTSVSEGILHTYAIAWGDLDNECGVGDRTHDQLQRRVKSHYMQSYGTSYTWKDERMSVHFKNVLENDVPQKM